MKEGGRVQVYRHLKKILMGLLAVVTLSMSTGFVAFAADIPDYRIQVSPVKLDLELSPGKTVEKKFIVQNTGSKVFRFELSTAPYSVKDEKYSQDLLSESDYTSISKWVTYSQDSGELEANEAVEITATVKVPKDVPAGGQYAVILARMLPVTESEATSGVNVYNEVGLLLISENIDGETRKAGAVVENKISSFLFVPPIQATSVVSNTGNVHVEAKYTLQVYPLFSDEEVYTNEEDPEKQLILPETRRFNTVTWDGAPQLGIFKVRQTVEFLGEKSVTEKVVFLCPIWFLLIILVLIFLAVFWIVSRSRGRKED